MEAARLAAEEQEAENGDSTSPVDGLDEILERFAIIDKPRQNYLYKIFSGYLSTEEYPFLTKPEMKRALSQLKSCTKISRAQMKFIEVVLGLNKDKISFHTFAVMATLIDHMVHRE